MIPSRFLFLSQLEKILRRQSRCQLIFPKPVLPIHVFEIVYWHGCVIPDNGCKDVVHIF